MHALGLARSLTCSLLQAVLGGKATPSAADVKAILTSGARRAGRAHARAPGDGHSHAKARLAR